MQSVTHIIISYLRSDGCSSFSFQSVHDMSYHRVVVGAGEILESVKQI